MYNFCSIFIRRVKGKKKKTFSYLLEFFELFSRYHCKLTFLLIHKSVFFLIKHLMFIYNLFTTFKTYNLIFGEYYGEYLLTYNEIHVFYFFNNIQMCKLQRKFGD